MSRTLRKNLILLLILIAICFLLYRARHSIGLAGFDWAQLGQSIRQCNPWLLLVSLLFIYAAYAVRAVRWFEFSRHLPNTSLPVILRYTYIGFTALFLLGRAGEPVRPVLIARKQRVPVTSTLGIYILERVWDMGATLVIAGLSLMSFPGVFAGAEGKSGLLGAMRVAGMVLTASFAVAVAGLIYLRVHGAPRLEARIAAWSGAGRLSGWRQRAANLLRGFVSGVHAIRSGRDFFFAAALSAIHWGLIVAIYLMVCRSFGAPLEHVTLAGALLVLACSMIGSSVQLPGIGGGSQVAAFVALTTFLHVEKEPAAAAAIAIWLVTFTAVSLIGIPLMIQEGWRIGELTHLAEEPSPGQAGPAESALGESSGAGGDAGAESADRKLSP